MLESINTDKHLLKSIKLIKSFFNVTLESINTDNCSWYVY